MTRNHITLWSLAALIVIFTFNIGLATIHQGRLLLVIASIYLTGVLFFLSLIFWFISFLKNPDNVWKWRFTILAILTFIASLASYFSFYPGFYIYERNIQEAKDRLELFIPELEKFFAANGYYPQSLTELGHTSFGENSPSFLIDYGIYKCQEIYAHDKNTLPLNISILDRHYSSSGAAYELCVHEQNGVDTSGTILVLYSGDMRWGSRTAYGDWEIGQGRRLVGQD